MKIRSAIAIFCLLPAAYHALFGDGATRWTAVACLGVVSFGTVAERWAARHRNSPLAGALFRGRVLSLSDLAFSALTFLGVYLLVITFAIRLNALDSPVFLTISFFAVFLGLMALVGALLLGFERLRTRGRSS